MRKYTRKSLCGVVLGHGCNGQKVHLSELVIVLLRSVARQIIGGSGSKRLRGAFEIADFRLGLEVMVYVEKEARGKMNVGNLCSSDSFLLSR